MQFNGHTLNPADWVDIASRRDPEAPCLVDSSGSVRTYSEVAADVAALAGSLCSRGIRPGNRIALLGTDSVEYLELVLASMRLGTVVVPINFRSTARELAATFDLVRPDVVYVDAAHGPVLVEAAELMPSVGRTYGGIDQTVGDEPSVRQLIEVGAAPVETSSCRDDDVLAIGLTSGTTGTPKAVRQSQRMFKSLVNNYLVETQLSPRDRLYSGAPLFHIAGLGQALSGLARGSSLLLLEQFDVNAVMAALQADELTFGVFMPTMISALLGHEDVRRTRYPALRAILYGGSPMPSSLLRETAEVFDCDLYNGFGAGTEAGGQAMLGPADHRRAFAGEERLLTSIGRAMHGVELKLCDKRGVEVAPGEVGEIFTRSETVMSGYLGRDDLTAARLSDGWFHGGDLAWRDAEGYLYLAGRSDDMLIRGGENIFPAEVESVLIDHPSVSDVAVVGLPDQAWGEIVAAFVVMAAGTPLELEDLRLFCRGRIASYKIPEVLHVVDQLPRNSTGKVLRSELKEVG